MNRIFQIGLLLLVAQLLNSCLGAPFVDHLSGEPIAGQAPYFHHKNLFINGDLLSVGIDPSRYANKVGDAADIYVVEHKNHTAWKDDPSLIDVMGGPTSFGLSLGNLSVNNINLGTLNVSDVSAYPYYKDFDIVADFDNNGVYDKNTDILDYIGVAEFSNRISAGGFTVIHPPDEDGDFEVGSLIYSGSTKQLPGSCRCTNIPPGIDISMIGKIFYPKENGPGHDLSSFLDTYPLVIIAHGNGGDAADFRGFEYLGTLLASRGYIVASIFLNDLSNNSTFAVSSNIYERGHAILLHLNYLLDDSSISNNFIENTLRPHIDRNAIGLVGHSRGGEGIIAAQEIHNSPSNNKTFEIAALCSLAPTDIRMFHGELICGPFIPKLPYLMISATRDRDLIENPGYRLLDQAARPKFGVSIYGGNHNYFNRDWNSDTPDPPVPSPPSLPMITEEQQQIITKIYVHSFLNVFLKGEQVYLPLFNNFTKPEIPRDNVLLTHYYQPTGWGNARLTVDNFEEIPHDINSNSLGENNNANLRIDTLIEDWLGLNLISTRNHYPHYSYGGRIAWRNAPQNMGTFEFELGRRSIMYYENLNFKIAQRYRNIPPPGSGNLNAAFRNQNLTVFLTDNSGNRSDAIAIGAYYNYETPYTDVHPYVTHRKSIMHTVTIPLRAFTANGAIVDLKNIDAITFQFEPKNIGELIIDDVEFLGLDFSEPDPRPISQVTCFLRRIFIKNWPNCSVYKTKKG